MVLQSQNYKEAISVSTVPKTTEEIMEKYICYDGSLPVCPEVEAMTDEEVEAEFQRLFGKNLKEDD